jgi:hypothetical protein
VTAGNLKDALLYIHTNFTEYYKQEWEGVLQSTNILQMSKGKLKVKVKVKLFPCLTKHHAMKTYWGSGGIAPCILQEKGKVASVLIYFAMMTFRGKVVPVLN